jgi:glycosyltransferase involved in cell wall biosynthesis
MRLVLRAGFDRYSGYGNDAVDLAVNLERHGVDVIPWPVAILPGLPREFTRLLEKDPGGRKDATLMFADVASVDPWEENWALATEKSFVYTMWERTPLLPSDVKAGPGRRTKRWSSYGVTGLVVTCPMNVEAFRAVDPVIPIGVVPCGIEPDDWPAVARVRSSPTQFLMIGMLGGRKNPFAVLETWQHLKETEPDFADAQLHVHTMSNVLHPVVKDVYGPGITFSNHALSRNELVELYHACDVLVTPSRGEGNNKPAMEFMATGGTVIGSDWSGHQNWLTPAAGYPVPGQLVPVKAEPRASEFEIDRDALAAAMLDVVRHKGRAVAKGEHAARWIREALSWDAVIPRLITFMERTVR